MYSLSDITLIRKNIETIYTVDCIRSHHKYLLLKASITSNSKMPTISERLAQRQRERVKTLLASTESNSNSTNDSQYRMRYDTSSSSNQSPKKFDDPIIPERLNVSKPPSVVSSKSLADYYNDRRQSRHSSANSMNSYVQPKDSLSQHTTMTTESEYKIMNELGATRAEIKQLRLENAVLKSQMERILKHLESK